MSAAAAVLSTSELAWLGVETPANRALTLTTLVTVGRLEAACVRSRIEDRLMTHARFRQRIDFSPIPLARPRWRDCDDFHLADHFTELDLSAEPEPTTLEGLADRLRSLSFAENRPLWQVHLAHLGAERSALILRVHAALADATAVPGLALGLTDEPPGEAADRRLEHAPLVPPQQVLERAGRGANATRALCNLITSRADRRNPFRIEIGAEKVSAWSDPIDLSAVLERADARDARPIDLVLSAVAGGLRRALHRSDFPAEDVSLRAVVPWSLRRPNDPPIGTQIAMALVQLPVSESSPDARLEAVRGQVERLSTAPEGLFVLGNDPHHGLSMTEIEERSLRLLGQKATLTLGVLEAPAEPCRLCGLDIGEIRWSPTLPGESALTVSVIDYAGALSFGAVEDQRLSVGPQQLADDMAAALLDL